MLLSRWIWIVGEPILAAIAVVALLLPSQMGLAALGSRSPLDAWFACLPIAVSASTLAHAAILFWVFRVQAVSFREAMRLVGLFMLMMPLVIGFAFLNGIASFAVVAAVGNIVIGLLQLATDVRPFVHIEIVWFTFAAILPGLFFTQMIRGSVCSGLPAITPTIERLRMTHYVGSLFALALLLFFLSLPIPELPTYARAACSAALTSLWLSVMGSRAIGDVAPIEAAGRHLWRLAIAVVLFATGAWGIGAAIRTL